MMAGNYERLRPTNERNHSESLDISRIDVRPYMNIVIGNENFRALIDTGATQSSIGETPMKAILLAKIGKILPTSLPVSMADGRGVQAIGRISCPVKVDQTEYHLDFNIIPRLHPNLTLGVDSLSRLQCQLDFRNPKQMDEIDVLPQNGKKPRRNRVRKFYLQMGDGKMGYIQFTKEGIVMKALPPKDGVTQVGEKEIKREEEKNNYKTPQTKKRPIKHEKLEEEEAKKPKISPFQTVLATTYPVFKAEDDNPDHLVSIQPNSVVVSVGRQFGKQSQREPIKGKSSRA